MERLSGRNASEGRVAVSFIDGGGVSVASEPECGKRVGKTAVAGRQLDRAASVSDDRWRQRGSELRDGNSVW